MRVLCESSRLHKPSKLLQKASKRLQKNIKRLQIPKTRSLCFLNALDHMPTKIGQFEHSAFFHGSHRIKSLKETWLWWKVWTLCLCVCTSPCGWGCTTYFVGDNLKLQVFSMVKFYNQCRGSGSDRKFKVAVEGIKFTTGFWRYRPKRLSTFWIRVQQKVEH